MVKEVIRRITRAIKWAKIGYRDYDFDYYHLLNVISNKLSMMEKYYSTSNIAESDTLVASQIRRANNLLKRIMDFEHTGFDGMTYINTRNKSRFTNPEIESFMNGTTYYHHMLYQEKAMNIFCNILSKNVFSWWN